MYDWEIGKHGIIADFGTVGGKLRSSTFLPEVMVE